MTIQIKESSSALASAGGARWKAVLISPGQGSSGFYSEAMLRETGPKAFPKGSHSYVDHPKSPDASDRSPKNLIGVLAEDAKYEDGVGLVGEIEVMPHWRDFVEAVAPHTGLSIFAEGAGRETDKGLVVESLLPHIMNSVDLVSYAGRGGALAERLYESAINTSVKTTESGPAIPVVSRIQEEKDESLTDNQVDELSERVDRLTESVQALLGIVQPLVESLNKPEEEPESVVEIDYALVAEAAVDAGLPKAARNIVYERVRLGGASVEDAISEQKAYVDSIKSQVQESLGATVRVGVDNPNQDFTVARWKVVA